MTNNGRCLNYNHGRPNAPMHFCPACGEVVVNNDISAEVCKEEKHARKRREGSSYCVDCGTQLIQ